MFPVKVCSKIAEFLPGDYRYFGKISPNFLAGYMLLSKTVREEDIEINDNEIQKVEYEYVYSILPCGRYCGLFIIFAVGKYIDIVYHGPFVNEKVPRIKCGRIELKGRVLYLFRGEKMAKLSLSYRPKEGDVEFK